MITESGGLGESGRAGRALQRPAGWTELSVLGRRPRSLDLYTTKVVNTALKCGSKTRSVWGSATQISTVPWAF